MWNYGYGATESYQTMLAYSGNNNFQYGQAPQQRGGYHEHNFLGDARRSPYWGPELESQYPFRFWMEDVKIWALASDIDAARQGPLVASRLGGIAYATARQIPDRMLAYGAQSGTETFTGLQILLQGLAQRFAPLTHESACTVLCEA